MSIRGMCECECVDRHTRNVVGRWPHAFDTKIVHAEQHVHLRGALLWRRAFWGYSGTILLNCLEVASRPSHPALTDGPHGTGVAERLATPLSKYFIFLILSYQLTFYHHGLEHHDLP